jgi:predicted DNA-binding WGR domain protein
VGLGIDLIRIDPPNNVHRFYRMEIMPGLFGDWSLIREWSRIAQPGQVRVDWCETEAAAKDARFAILIKKAKRGYEWPGAGPTVRAALIFALLNLSFFHSGAYFQRGVFLIQYLEGRDCFTDLV